MGQALDSRDKQRVNFDAVTRSSPADNSRPARAPIFHQIACEGSRACIPFVASLAVARHDRNLDVHLDFANITRSRQTDVFHCFGSGAASGRPWSPHAFPHSRRGTSCRFPDCVCEELSRFADMSGKRRPARKSEAQHSPHEEPAKHRDLPKLFGQELQAHFKPLQDLPHRMFTLLKQLKNIRAPRK